jgi:hypothetical protein
MNRYPLTQTQFETLRGSDWQIQELPYSEWDKVPNLPRRDDVVAVFYSGCMNQTKCLNGISSVVGFDIVAHEERPQPGEPALNVYHAVIQQLDAARNPVPFLLHAPFRDETLFGHWGGYELLQKYIDALAPQPNTPSKIPTAGEQMAVSTPLHRDSDANGANPTPKSELPENSSKL